jgi:hypothetical protein
MRNIWKDKRRREERKREKRKKIGEMVGDQTAKQSANPLKKGKQKNIHQFWNSRIAVLVVVRPLL